MGLPHRGSRQISTSRPAAALRRIVGVAVLLAVGSLGISACGSSTSAVPFKASMILSVDQATRTVHLNLVGSETGVYGGFNFDGYGAGSLRVHIPLGWTVDVTCKNGSTVFTHSCAVIEDRPISPYGGPLAFSDASTPNPTSGLPCGGSAAFSFVASKLGTFRIACLVIGHEADGMWDWLVVTPGGRPTVVI